MALLIPADCAATLAKGRRATLNACVVVNCMAGWMLKLDGNLVLRSREAARACILCYIDHERDGCALSSGWILELWSALESKSVGDVNQHIFRPCEHDEGSTNGEQSMSACTEDCDTERSSSMFVKWRRGRYFTRVCLGS